MEKTIINDSENHRIIVKDWDNDQLIINGDYVPSTLTVYCVVCRVTGWVYSICLTYDYAVKRRDYYATRLKNVTFHIVSRNLFI